MDRVQTRSNKQKEQKREDAGAAKVETGEAVRELNGTRGGAARVEAEDRGGDETRSFLALEVWQLSRLTSGGVHVVSS